MSTLLDPLPEPDPREITERLRSYMGNKKISRSKLALAAGIGRTPLGAKLDDNGQFTLNELLAIARALGKSWLWVMTGVDDPADGGGGPDDGGRVAPPDGLEPSTARLTVGSSAN